jgi:hypothetical protein
MNRLLSCIPGFLIQYTNTSTDNGTEMINRETAKYTKTNSAFSLLPVRVFRVFRS